MKVCLFCSTTLFPLHVYPPHAFPQHFVPPPSALVIATSISCCAAATARCHYHHREGGYRKSGFQYPCGFSDHPPQRKPRMAQPLLLAIPLGREPSRKRRVEVNVRIFILRTITSAVRNRPLVTIPRMNIN